MSIWKIFFFTGFPSHFHIYTCMMLNLNHSTHPFTFDLTQHNNTWCSMQIINWFVVDKVTYVFVIIRFSNHQPHDCLLNRLFRRRSKKTTKLRVTGLCAGNSPVPGEFPAQMASHAENVSIWWHHHVIQSPVLFCLYVPAVYMKSYAILIL